MFSRLPFQPREPAPITKADVLNAAAHWRRIANEQDAIANRETELGLPRGDVRSFRNRARLYHEIAANLQTTAESMPEPTTTPAGAMAA